MKLVPSQLLVLIPIVAITSCVQESNPLEEAKAKITNAKFIGYDEVSMWENPIDRQSLIDTNYSYNEFSVNDQNFIGYDFMVESDGSDLIYKNEEYRLIDHRDKIVEIHTLLQFENTAGFEKMVKAFTPFKWSPMTFLNEDWEFFSDTVINESNYTKYFQIEKDTVFEERRVYVERYIYINKETALLERFERIAYEPDGTIGQLISRDFYNYQLNPMAKEISYKEPEYYTSTYGRRKRFKMLEEGEEAPLFKLVDMNGDSLSLDQFKGKKVMLNFSVINCGFCQMTLEHINRESFELDDEIAWIYINPEDDKERLDVYTKKLPIPFPVLINAKEIGESYGVNGYPTFFLINEEGVIETVQSGYFPGFIDKYKI